jgi:hypothetical protein
MKDDYAIGFLPPLIVLGTVCLVLLTGCATGPDTKSPLDRVEFGPDECGTAEISGTVDLNGNPFVSSNVYLSVQKQKPCPPQ